MDQLLQLIWDHAVVSSLFALMIGFGCGALVTNTIWVMNEPHCEEGYSEWSDGAWVCVEKITDADYPPVPWS